VDALLEKHLQDDAGAGFWALPCWLCKAGRLCKCIASQQEECRKHFERVLLQATQPCGLSLQPYLFEDVSCLFSVTAGQQVPLHVLQGQAHLTCSAAAATTAYAAAATPAAAAAAAWYE
jgi:hypothetical protein